MKPFEFTVLLDVIAEQLGLEWLRAAGAPSALPETALPRLPVTVAPAAAAHCAEIERLVRIGHVRAIEAEIDALEALAPEAAPLANRMRQTLDSFDLKALADLAKGGQADAR
jgi:hypothetical protein